jgi:DNA polymerase III epsilon subunit-like protein
VLKNIYAEKIENYQLKTLANYFEIKNHSAHNALSDALTLKRVIYSVAFKLKRPGIDIFCKKFKNGKEFQ